MSRKVMVMRVVSMEIDADVWEQAYGNGDAGDDAEKYVPEILTEVLGKAFDDRGLVVTVTVGAPD